MDVLSDEHQGGGGVEGGGGEWAVSNDGGC